MRQYPARDVRRHAAAGADRRGGSLGPGLLLADEPTTGLDVTTQAGIMDLIRGLQRARGMALLLISHDLALVSTHLHPDHRALSRRSGGERHDTRQIVGSPRHPYTQALLAATPRSSAGSVA